MAVKRIRSTVDEKEQKQLLMDLEVVMKSNECVYIVQFYGALFKEVIYLFTYKQSFMDIILHWQNFFYKNIHSIAFNKFP